MNLFAPPLGDFLDACTTSPHGLTFTWWRCCGLCQKRQQTKLAHSFLFCSSICFCLHGPFNCISLHTFSRELSFFSLCASDLISALLVLSAIYIYLYESLPQPRYNPLWLTGLKASNKYPTKGNSGSELSITELFHPIQMSHTTFRAKRQETKDKSMTRTV